jgi:hypothetical protein
MKKSFRDLVGGIVSETVPVLIVSSGRVAKARYDKNSEKFYIYSVSQSQEGKIAVHGPFLKSDKRFRII